MSPRFGIGVAYPRRNACGDEARRRERAPRRILLLGFAGLCVALLSAFTLLSVSTTTAGAAESGLARTYELVTPNPNPSEKVNVLPTDVVGEEGNEVVFQTRGSRETGPSEVLNTYLSRRTANGWQTKLLSPPSVYNPNYHPEYDDVPNDFYVFNGDLSKGIFSTEPLDPPLVEGEPAESNNLYEQETTTGAETLITPLPGGSIYEPPRVAAASANLEHVLFENGSDYFENSGYKPTVYDWSPEEGMTIASILPDGRIATEASAGAGPLSQISTDAGASAYSFRDGGNPHAISENGERIFFTDPAPAYGTVIGNIYERRNQGKPDASTVQIDKPAPGTPETEPVRFGDYSSTFIDATPNGRKVLFASCTKLTSNSTASGGRFGNACRAKYESKDDEGFFQSGGEDGTESDLYIYSEEEGSETGNLTDITTQDPTGAKVLGVLGESEDLSRVYFVADGVLAPGGVEGKPNLYVWAKTGESTEETTFIATLETPEYYFNSEGDLSDWEYGVTPLEHNARVSQNGEYVAFASESPTIDPSYDNISAENYEPLQEVYLYKYGSSGPICVSCVGAGPARAPADIANFGLSELERALPQYSDSEKRNLLNNGTLYFETGEKLVAADENETTDVYEYDAEAGTIGLISSGTGEGPSHFMGATANGSNVFFSTDQALLPADEDNNVDIYDACFNGGVVSPCGVVSPLPTPKQCQDGCPATPGSVEFYGPSVPAVPAPPPATKPFSVAKITAAQIKQFARSGKLTLKATVPGAGALSAKALAKLAKATKRSTVASAKTQAGAAGQVELTLKLSKKARSTLEQAGKLAVTIKVTFGSETKTAHLTLKATKSKSKGKAKKGKAKAKKGKGKSSSGKSNSKTGGSH